MPITICPGLIHYIPVILLTILFGARVILCFKKKMYRLFRKLYTRNEASKQYWRGVITETLIATVFLALTLFLFSPAACIHAPIDEPRSLLFPFLHK